MSLAEGPFIVDVELMYQPIGYPWAHNLGDQKADEIVTEVRQAVEDAAGFADAQPVPKPEHGLLNVFAEGSVPLHRS